MVNIKHKACQRPQTQHIHNKHKKEEGCMKFQIISIHPKQINYEALSYIHYLNYTGTGPVGLQHVDHPHGQVADEEEGDHLPAWLVTNM